MDYDFNDNWQLTTEFKLADKDSSLPTFDYGDIQRIGTTRDLGSGVFALGKTELTAYFLLSKFLFNKITKLKFFL